MCKKCNKCKIERPLKDFYVRSETGSVRGTCKLCACVVAHKYRENNKDVVLATEKRYRELHRNQLRKRCRTYYKKTRPAQLKSMRRYYWANRGRLLEYHREYCRQNPEKISASRKNWYLKNRDRAVKRAYQYSLRRRGRDVCYRLAQQLRTRLYMAIRGNVKTGSAVRDLGCSIARLRCHLEKKFQKGMSWKNYGRRGWHIDHVVPLSAFDLTSLRQLKRACHYTNLQPLWAVDNLRKNNRIL